MKDVLCLEKRNQIIKMNQIVGGLHYPRYPRKQLLPEFLDNTYCFINFSPNIVSALRHMAMQRQKQKSKGKEEDLSVVATRRNPRTSYNYKEATTRLKI